MSKQGKPATSKRGLAVPVQPDVENIVTTWRLLAEDKGLTLQQALNELNGALGTKIQHGRVASWQYGKSRPGVDVIAYMLDKTLPHLLAEAGLSSKTITKIQQKISVP